jgi:hypothetical protein
VSKWEILFRWAINLTLMGPPPVKRQNEPLTASGGFFRVIPARKVHLSLRALAAFPYTGANRLAAPDTYRGAIAAEAAMAAVSLCVPPRHELTTRHLAGNHWSPHCRVKCTTGGGHVGSRLTIMWMDKKLTTPC